MALSENVTDITKSWNKLVNFFQFVRNFARNIRLFFSNATDLDPSGISVEDRDEAGYLEYEIQN